MKYLYIYFFTLLYLDGSGMDFRTMLKKKKYAKHMVEDQDPDWGSLKHVEKEEPEPEPVVKEVCYVLLEMMIIFFFILTGKNELKTYI